MEKKKRSRFLMTEEHLNFIRKAIEEEKDLDLNDKKNMINLKKKIFIIFANKYDHYCNQRFDLYQKTNNLNMITLNHVFHVSVK